jgi:hypothetical protein
MGKSGTVAVLTWLVAAHASAKVPLNTIVASKDVPANIPDGQLDQFSGYSVAGSGEVTFESVVTSPTNPVPQGVWRASLDEKPQLVLARGMKLPGREDITIKGVFYPLIDDAGHLVTLINVDTAKGEQKAIVI